MPNLSTSGRYGNVAITIHWISVVLVVALFALGFMAAEEQDASLKIALLRFHVPLGVAMLVLTLFRIFWWWVYDEKPVSLPMPGWQDRLSGIVHKLLYIVILGMGASGIGMLVLSGAGASLTDAAASTLPDFTDYAPRVPHGIGAGVFMALLVLHASAALYHHFITKDGLLRRMWFQS